MSIVSHPDSTQGTALAIAAPHGIQRAETASASVGERAKAMVQARAIVALERPRNFDLARLKLMAACKRPGFAGVARYKKPVGGKDIMGLSVRFAEEARVLWGNIDVRAAVIYDDDEKRIYSIEGIDLETNASDTREVVVTKTVERKFPKAGDEIIRQRTNSKGETVSIIKADEDAFFTKERAAIAKERREVILSLIPADVKEECERQVIVTLKDADEKDPEKTRRDLLLAFYDVGIMPDAIDTYLGHSALNLTPAELNELRKVYVALKDGETTWAELLEAKGVGAETKKPAEKQRGTEGMKARIQARRSQAEPAPVSEGPPPATAADAAAALQEDSEEAMREFDRKLAAEEGQTP